MRGGNYPPAKKGEAVRYMHVAMRVAAPDGDEPTRVLSAEELAECLDRDTRIARAERAARQTKTTSKLPAARLPRV